MSVFHNVGPIPWLMVAELFLQEARPIAVTIATIVNWLANFVVGLAFPYILVSSYNYSVHTHTHTQACIHACTCTHNNSPSPSHYGDLLSPQAFLYPYGTVVFIMSGALLWVYLFIYLPETKGRSIDDITMEFRNKTRTRGIEIDPAD